ncbi:hypothetical protein F5884DRAFT_763369 [Xylogone sp. PMI_703]|nr:hypothetical protein F5884DRAFT_763369 [Xylogone sp. PMI_703]
MPTIMASQSFNRHFISVVTVLVFSLPRSSRGWLSGHCSGDFIDIPDVLRIGLMPNIWASNQSLTALLGFPLWLGEISYPVLPVLSTLHNNTYISTSSAGSRDEPCPPTYTYAGGSYFPNYTYGPEMICHDYYNFTLPPLFTSDSPNFTGSPEDLSVASSLRSASARYGLLGSRLVTPYISLQSPPGVGSITSNSYYSMAPQVFGFVSRHEDQVLGLGLNSTLLNTLYSGGYIASRSVGLWYGIPSSDPNIARNGSIVFGGYSASRLLGGFANQTYPIGAWQLPRHCLWEIKVARVSSGPTVISSNEFGACVEPSEPSLVLPSALYNQLSSDSSSSDVGIKLSNGLNITIPSSLISIRPVTDDDQSPILGIPFLSQVLLFADYQERTLSIGLANNTQPLLIGSDNVVCVEHSNTTGYLGWAVGSPEDLTTSSVSSTLSVALPTHTSEKNNGVLRIQGGMGLVLFMMASICFIFRTYL